MKTQAKNIALFLALLMTSLFSMAQSGLIIDLKDGRTLKFESSNVESITIDKATTPVGDAPSIGDFYYSDGTWSTDLDKSKTPIAIVFYVGDPSADDEGMRADHPDCTHGLAIAITEVIGVGWQEKYETYGASKTVSDWLTANGYPDVKAKSDDDSPINKRIGYTCSKYLRAFNASADNAAWPVTAMAAVDNFSATCPAPPSSSGWYLGSARELVLACFGEIEGNLSTMGRQDAVIRDLINGRLQQLAATDVTLFDTTGWTYWTCHEYGLEGEAFWSERAWPVYFVRDKNSVYPSFKSFSEYASARPILAF